MKRTLIATLVASALELYAAAATAQVAGVHSCANGAASLLNGATPVTVGPLNPVDGFPEFVTDSKGVSVQRCLNVNFCFFDPVVPTDPFSIQIGSGVEAFYWGLGATVTNAAGDRSLAYTASAESAFLQVGPNGEPINGAQFAFLRLRFVMGVPVDGTYTITHPYGKDVFPVTGATGARDIFFTVDRGLTPGTVGLQGAVGPWMKSVSAPLGFLGDGGPLAAPDLAFGGPCNIDPATGNNYIEISGIDTNGKAVDFGGGTGETILHGDFFTIQGQLYDGRVQTPVTPSRLTYSRTAAGAGQIDSFATSTATASVTVKDGPNTPAANSRIATAQTLDRAAFTPAPTTGVDSLSTVLAIATTVPALLSVTATDATALTPTDPTTLNLPLIDFVDISQAEWDPATGRLSVTAASGDARGLPTLTLRDFGTFTRGNPIFTTTTTAPPGLVHVDSAGGGSAVANVRVVAAVPPGAPSGLVSTGSTTTTVSLRWIDGATNESGFRIYTVAAGGARTQVAAVGANVTAATVTGLTAGTTYTFQVEAFNGSGAAVSNTVTASTLALPVAAGTPTSALSTTVTRGIDVSFADNSTDETAFQVQRATVTAGVVGTFATVGTVNVTAPATTGGAITFTDTSGPPATGTSYAYRVITVRGVDSSAPSANSLTLTTPAAPTGNAAPTFGATTGNSVVVNWTRRNTTETGYLVYRATVTGGVAGAFSVVSGATPLGLVSTYTDNTAAPNTTYQYRINAVGWANYTTGVNGTVSASVTTPTTVSLAAPTNLAATAVTRPVLTWGDASTGETNYRASRTPITVNANGSVTAGATTIISSTIAANATTFTDTVNQTTGNTVRYDVQALNGATAGPAAQAYTAIGGLPTANQPTAARVNGVARVNVSWTALTTAAIGGYEIQRCVSTGAGSTTCRNTSPFTKVTGTAVNTTGTVDGRATNTFGDTTVARTTNYVYRMRTVGGAGTGLVGGTFSASRAVSTN
ncbi:MAG: hypothetical protein RIQ60_979 [Pseudomonadota bacterium]|jgi:hypothetical protein